MEQRQLEEKYQFIEKIITFTDLYETLKFMSDLIQEQQLSDGHYITLLDEDKKNLVLEQVVFPSSMKEMEEVIMENKIVLDEKDLDSICLSENRAIHLKLEDLETYPQEVQIKIKFWNVAQAVHVPFGRDGQMIGTLYLFVQKGAIDSKKLEDFQEKMRLLYYPVKNLIDVSRMRKKAHGIREITEKSRKFLEIAQKINNLTSLQSIYEVIMEGLFSIYSFDAGFIFMHSGERLDYVYGYESDHGKKECIKQVMDAFIRENDGYALQMEDAATSIAFMRNMHFYFPDVQKVLHLPMARKDKELILAVGEARSLFIVPIRMAEKPIGVFQFWSVEDEVHLSDTDLQVIDALCSFISTAISNARFYSLIEEQKQKIEEKKNIIEQKNNQLIQDLKLAQQIQRNLIPEIPPVFPGLKIASLYKPMEEVGGDFYDFVKVREAHYLGIFISDVSGHGVPAALITSMLKTLIETAGAHRVYPKNLLEYVNQKIIGHTSGNFLTAFYGLYNRETRELVYSRAAHPYPVIIRGETLITLEGRGKMLGIWPDPELSEVRLTLCAGDKLILFTDGLLEATNFAGLEYTDFFEQDLMKMRHLPIDELVEGIYNGLIHFAETWHFDDDICIVGIEIE